MLEEEVYLLENSLKNYIFRALDRASAQQSSSIKYRGLSLKLDVKDKFMPCFKVRIGPFEAFFRISDGLKFKGSLCGDEKYVTKWFQSGSNRIILKTLTEEKISITKLNKIDSLLMKENHLS